MERPWKQFEFWPKPMSPKELKEKLDKENDELRRAGDYGNRKGEDLVSKEETTKALEGKGAKSVKIPSFKEGEKKAREFLEKLEEKERSRSEENKKKNKKS